MWDYETIHQPATSVAERNINMQVKTIEKNIVKKLEEWINTINDEDLKKKLKKNILVSGGSITSMFLGEDVNDYDVYIKDKNTLIDLVKYYTRQFSEITILNGDDRDRLLEDLEDKYHGADSEDIKNIYAISVRNLKPDQVKLFFESKSGGIVVNEDKKEEDNAYLPKFFSPNAISLFNKVQIVIRFHGDDKQIHSTFDFIHATNYFTFEDGLVTNKEALESILTKQLKYQGSLYPLTTIIRVRKFIKRGWNINAGELLKTMFQISQLDLTNPDVLEEQLIGVDVAYFSKLIEILRGVPKESLTSTYLNTLIDKVFGAAELEE